MKKILIFALSILLIFSCKKENEQTFPPTTIAGLELSFIKVNESGNFNAVFFLDENEGYVAGYNGMIYKTTNGGNSWTTQVTSTTLPLYDIIFLNKMEGFAVGGNSHNAMGSVILKTTDGGQIWNKISFEGRYLELTSICFTDDSTGFAIGNHYIFSTVDKGVHWIEKATDSLGANMRDIEFADKNNGLIACGKEKLLKTTDAGNNWTITTPFIEQGSSEISIVNNNLVFSAFDTKIYKSNDFGSAWTNLSSYPAFSVFKLLFISENYGFAFGRGIYSGGDFGSDYGSIYYTINGGATWIGSNKVHEISIIKDACFPLPNVGYAVSYNTVVKIIKK